MPSENQNPPGGLPVYRLITGPDDAEFCERVSESLKLGYKLHGSPTSGYNGTEMIVAQAVIWPYIESTREDRGIGFRGR